MNAQRNRVAFFSRINKWRNPQGLPFRCRICRGPTSIVGREGTCAYSAGTGKNGSTAEFHRYACWSINVIRTHGTVVRHGYAAKN